MKHTKYVIGIISRIIVLILTVLFVLQVLPQPGLTAIIPAMSPYLAISSAVVTRSISMLFFLCIPVLLLALLKGRWFCAYACPMGLTAEIAGKLSFTRKSVFQRLPRLGPWIVLFTAGGSLVSYLTFLWLDPLAIFSGFLNIWRLPLTLTGALPGLGFVSIILLSFFMPNAWCYRICPLGASQEMLGNLSQLVHARLRSASARHAQDKSGRRLFLAAAGGGIVAMLAGKTAGYNRVIRPPGAVTEKRFTAVCARCGNCINACPENIIHHDLGRSGIAGLLTPAITFGPKGYCNEKCNACCKVCPTGAIKHLSLEEKFSTVIGTAKVIRPLCLSWEKNVFCMVCYEYCPYQAVKTVTNDRGVVCPVVDTDACRGCGICELVCPSERLSITVEPCPQRKL